MYRNPGAEKGDGYRDGKGTEKAVYRDDYGNFHSLGQVFPHALKEEIQYQDSGRYAQQSACAAIQEAFQQ